MCPATDNSIQDGPARYRAGPFVFENGGRDRCPLKAGSDDFASLRVEDARKR
jgi:hypothetical protein